jgi:hypothetical protein
VHAHQHQLGRDLSPVSVLRSIEPRVDLLDTKTGHHHPVVAPNLGNGVRHRFPQRRPRPLALQGKATPVDRLTPDRRPLTQARIPRRVEAPPSNASSTRANRCSFSPGRTSRAFTPCPTAGNVTPSRDLAQRGRTEAPLVNPRVLAHHPPRLCQPRSNSPDPTCASSGGSVSPSYARWSSWRARVAST